MEEIEKCNECGKSVSFGSGRFVNRIPDCGDVETRRKDGKLDPEGDYMCWLCSTHIDADALLSQWKMPLKEVVNAYKVKVYGDVDEDMDTVMVERLARVLLSAVDVSECNSTVDKFREVFAEEGQ